MTMMKMRPLLFLPLLLLVFATTSTMTRTTTTTVVAFTQPHSASSWLRPMAAATTTTTTTTTQSSGLFAVVTSTNKNKAVAAGYEPKWTKKSTLADKEGDANSLGFDKVGLKGTIPVVFRTVKTDNSMNDLKTKKKKKQEGAAGDDNQTRQQQQPAAASSSAPTQAVAVVEEKTSMAWAGQPIRDVATQAGQYIRYSCGKGECGTCECMINGKWVRPCVDVIPADAGAVATSDQPLVIQVKAVKSKAKSSGKFFSIRSFIMGFWNNLLGMIGFVKFRRAANQNWEERRAYEELVRVRTIEKRMQRLAREAAAAASGKRGSGSSPSGGGLANA
jgi:ferredoxin